MSAVTAADRKATALNFLRLVRAGRRVEAEALVAPGARHHNPFFAAGMAALFDAVEAAAKMAPDRTADVKCAVAEDDYVTIHSHMRPAPGDRGASVVHIFRFEGDRIAEIWDVGQAVPEHNANSDGMF